MIRQHERRTGTVIDINMTGLPEQAPEFVKIALCRYIQETLNNAFKHAGGCEHSVNVDWDGAIITVEVADCGPGIIGATDPSNEPRLGLAGLRDRIESIGGKLIIKSTPDAGTRIRASLPLGEKDAASLTIIPSTETESFSLLNPSLTLRLLDKAKQLSMPF
jgi:signal transduction histidine kinase